MPLFINTGPALIDWVSKCMGMKSVGLDLRALSIHNFYCRRCYGLFGKAKKVEIVPIFTSKISLSIGEIFILAKYITDFTSESLNKCVCVCV